jgi:hypothetical protein
MDYTINFTWRTQRRSAVVVPENNGERISLCAFLKDDDLIKEFGPFININIEGDDLENPVTELDNLKKIVLQSAEKLPVVERVRLRKLPPQDLMEKLRLLENDYAKRFTGLNNHKMLSEIWHRIKIIKEELGKRPLFFILSSILFIFYNAA